MSQLLQLSDLAEVMPEGSVDRLCCLNRDFSKKPCHCLVLWFFLWGRCFNPCLLGCYQGLCGHLLNTRSFFQVFDIVLSVSLCLYSIVSSLHTWEEPLFHALSIDCKITVFCIYFKYPSLISISSLERVKSGQIFTSNSKRVTYSSQTYTTSKISRPCQ